MDDKEHWLDEYTAREKSQIRHAVRYAEYYADAGIPGHGHYLLIAKLVATIQEMVIAQQQSVQSNNTKDQFSVN